MLKRLLKAIGIPAVALAGMLAFVHPSQAKAALHFGVSVGGPVYTYPYPYEYGIDPYGYPSYYSYGYSYAYPGSYYTYPYSYYSRPYWYSGRAHRDFRGHNFRRGNERHGRNELYGGVERGHRR